MALMLCLLQNMMSSIMSCLVMARPRFASNSWRSAPLKTTRLPLSFIMPSSIRNVRKPIRCVAVSTIAPSWPITTTCSSYSAGLSALHGLTSNEPETMPVSSDAANAVSHTTLPLKSFSVADTVAAFFALRTASSASSEPVAVSGFQSASTFISSMCTCGCAASSTERNRPCKRQ